MVCIGFLMWPSVKTTAVFARATLLRTLPSCATSPLTFSSRRKPLNVVSSPNVLKPPAITLICSLYSEFRCDCPVDLPLTEVIEVARAHNIPVVVDAAAQLPLVSNLWTFTQMGADLAIFSG